MSKHGARERLVIMASHKALNHETDLKICIHQTRSLPTRLPTFLVLPKRLAVKTRSHFSLQDSAHAVFSSMWRVIRKFKAGYS